MSSLWPVAATVVLVTMGAQRVSALEVDLLDGKISGHFDTTMTAGVVIRAQERSNDLIGIGNGGSAYSNNGDDGNLNYSAGDPTSALMRVTHELQLGWRGFQVFNRFFYFYDPVIESAGTRRTPLSSIAKRRAGLRIQLLDAYIAKDFELFDRPFTVRAGNQVLSWGESTFIQNGINVINPVDVTLLRVPGAELRNALRPIPAIDISTSLTDRFSVEAYYQFMWESTDLEPRGTFFSTSDLVSPGAKTAILGFGSVGDNPIPPPTSSFGNSIPRGKDHDAGDDDQWGIAFRYFEPWLWGTEFGLYYIRHHSRLPVISARTGTLKGAEEDLNYAGSATYFLDYPENIDLFGISFSNEIGTTGVALQGEVSYKIGQPLQLDDVELLYAGFSAVPVFGPIFNQNQIGVFGLDQEVQGWRRKDILQPQVTVTKLFGPTLGSDQLLVLGEIGATVVLGMQDKSVLRYEGPGTYTSANPFFTKQVVRPPNPIQPVTTTKGFADPRSWGYRVVMRPTFNRAIGAINLEPTVAFQHDVEGTSPSPILNFVENRKAASISLRGVYLEKITGEIGYSNFFDGGPFNLIKDRDFVSLAFSYLF